MSSKGFTLIELLVGFVVSTIILVAALSVYAYFLRVNSRLIQSDSLIQAKNDLAQEFATSIRWANSICVPASLDCPVKFIIDGHEYYLQNNRLYKDSTPLTPLSISVTSFTVANHSTSSQFASVQIDIEMSEAQTKFFDSLHQIISQRITVSQQ